jgi:hypothetical protein
MMELYRKIGYSAVGLGLAESRLGDELLNQAKANDIPVLQVDTESHDYEVPYLIKNVGGVKVGVVSFGCVPPGRDEFDLLKKRFAAYSEARRKSDILVLLDQAMVATDEWLERNGKRFGAPDIVIGGTYQLYLAEPKMVGKTMICPTSVQGTSMGVVKIEVLPGQDPKLVYERAVMDDNITPDPNVTKYVEAYKEKQRQAVAQVTHPDVAGSNGNKNGAVMSVVSHQPSSAYNDSGKCKSCHSSQFISWQKDKHSKALQTLIKESKVIPECLQCHSEMYRETNRLELDANVPTGVECASCHASVLPHGADIRKKGPTQQDRDACLTCHTKERSPDFNLETYWEKAKHK